MMLLMMNNLVEVNPIESAIILGVFIIIIYVIVRKIKKIIKRRKLAKGKHKKTVYIDIIPLK